tara:strand:+ start:1458 stop:3194 length:1737 start_codon:yes stop_codon:yes gene_type:complete
MSSFLEYHTPKTEDLFSQLEELAWTNVKQPQNYNPIYDTLFDLTPSTANAIQLNQKFMLQKLLAKENDSIYNAVVYNNRNNETKEVPVFFKYSPLLDPVKFMMGKYEDSDITIPTFGIVKDTKIYHTNNSAYVDGFFNFLTSQLLQQYHFIHGIEFYGSFIGLKHGFKVNIEEELSMIYQSDYYQLHKDTKIKLLGNIDDYLYQETDSRNYKHKLSIQSNSSLKSNLSIEIMDEELNELFLPNTTTDSVTIEPLTEHNLSAHNNENVELGNASNSSATISSSDCSSRSSITHDENSESDSRSHSGSDSGSDTGSHSSSSVSTISTSEALHAEIDVFPVNMIAIEKCDMTFDKYIVKEDVSNAELCAALMQIIMTLITYQKCFKLTHNDLHTNNVMISPTEKEHIVYQYDNKYYKVPTFGKVYKIIDFGRAIYTYKDRTYYSDSFSKEGDATTQYNCEPYYNDTKPMVEPNYSFDLCRLACSLFDLIIDEDKDLKELQDPLCKVIADWCTDDKGRNVLYKSDGEERYPGFKLYKMIARTVHNHVPHKQLERDIFSGYRIAKSKVNKKTRIVNIDAMIVM